MPPRQRATADDCLRRSACPIANTLDLIGDKWTLVVIRDMLFLDKHLYGEFVESEERIPTNILSDRLKRLESARVIEKRRYQANPPRFEYRLTRKGKDLFPVLREMITWGNQYLPGTNVPPEGMLEILAERLRED
jgi:DNA-binding HxlR family transcriptional regulator